MINAAQVICGSVSYEAFIPDLTSSFINTKYKSDKRININISSFQEAHICSRAPMDWGGEADKLTQGMWGDINMREQPRMLHMFLYKEKSSQPQKK